MFFSWEPGIVLVVTKQESVSLIRSKIGTRKIRLKPLLPEDERYKNVINLTCEDLPEITEHLLSGSHTMISLTGKPLNDLKFAIELVGA
ncbi:hypothetical protein IJ380_00445 [Candidatus Saccharibacteria bacterium]|nr:hypothetical protein [Candidatus Saccharibacteria bacterium]